MSETGNRSTARRRKAKKRRAEEWANYELRIVGDWHASYSVSWDEEEERRSEFLDLAVKVEFPEPVREVSQGGLTIYGTNNCTTGGELNYDGEKFLHGCLWIGIPGVQAMITLLGAGNGLSLDLTGRPFRYRRAWIRHVGWFTDGHPDFVCV